ncbi:hypothetical protein [Rickettsia gravesii]|uniref:hypothetical protein n=1 Tax=Rickettsia gravesii TaxID=354585 RepID=UPI00037D65C0|nr:hypothetical protein [Rickettsia gravesii]
MKMGKTPLHMAIDIGNIEIVGLLLENMNNDAIINQLKIVINILSCIWQYKIVI